jgi:hypothetical protein
LPPLLGPWNSWHHWQWQPQNKPNAQKITTPSADFQHIKMSTNGLLTCGFLNHLQQGAKCPRNLEANNGHIQRHHFPIFKMEI